MAVGENLVRLDPQPGYKFRKWKDDANKKIKEASKEFTARNYQLEMLEAAKRENTIVLMPTGAGKTFVAVLLIKHFSYQLQLPIEKGGKRTFFLVNQVTLVAQQGKVLEDHTGLKVGKYSGASNKAGRSIDHWDIDFWRQELYEHEIIVCTAEIFRKMLAHKFISPTDINVLVLDECHHAKLKKNHPMSKIMQNFWAPYVNNGAGRVLGLTASVIDQRNCKVESLRLQLRDLEKCLLCKIVTPRQFSSDIDAIATPTPEIQPYDYTAYGGVIKGELENLLGVLNSVEGLPETDKSTFKKVKHIIRNLPFVIKEVGLDALRRTLPYYINEVENFLCTPLLVTGEVSRYTLTVILSQLNILLKHSNRYLN